LQPRRNLADRRLRLARGLRHRAIAKLDNMLEPPRHVLQKCRARRGRERRPRDSRDNVIWWSVNGKCIHRRVVTRGFWKTRWCSRPFAIARSTACTKRASIRMSCLRGQAFSSSPGAGSAVLE